MFNNKVLLFHSKSFRCFYKNVWPKVVHRECERSLYTSPTLEDKLKWSYVHCPGKKPLLNLTIGKLVDQVADQSGDVEAIVDVPQGIRKTYGQVKEEVDNLAAGFLSLGLMPGDTIGIWGPNTYEWYLTFLAAGRLGLILVTINPAFQAEELKYCIQKVDMKILVCPETFKTQDFYKLVESIAPEITQASPGGIYSKSIPSLKHLLIISKNKYPGAFKFSDILEAASNKQKQDVQDLQDVIQSDQPCNIQFTSGTTGSPKATTLSHHNLVNNSFFGGDRIGFEVEKERLCISVPFFHCYGNVIGLLTSLHFASTLIVPSPGFNPEQSIQVAEKEKCTVLYGTPTMHVDHINVPNFEKYDLSKIWVLLSGGAIFPEELMKKIKQKIEGTEIVSIYGMTETSPLSICRLPNCTQERLYTAIGYPMDYIEVKVVDLDNKIVPVDTPGQLFVRGYINMLGYWKDKAATTEIMKEDRWLNTGDLAVMYDDGYCQLVGRTKDMVIRGGENIFPREIEDYLFGNSKILEAVVVGVPDSRMGEELCAWIRLKEGETLTEQDIRKYCKGNIAHFKIPKYILFTETFPKTMSGKIQKYKVVEESIKVLNINN